MTETPPLIPTPAPPPKAITVESTLRSALALTRTLLVAKTEALSPI